MKFKNMQKGRVIEHKESGALAIVLNINGTQAEVVFQNPYLNPFDSGYCGCLLTSEDAEEFRLIERPVIGTVYEVDTGLVLACESVDSENDHYFFGWDGIKYLYDYLSMPAIGFI